MQIKFGLVENDLNLANKHLSKLKTAKAVFVVF